MVDNREIATIIWLIIVSGWALSGPGVRRSLADILATVVRPVIAIPLSLLTLWVIVLVATGSRTGLWTPALLKDSLIWFFGSAIVLFLNLETAWKSNDFFRRTVLSAAGWSAYLAFFVNLYVFHLIIELLLFPVLVVLTVMSAYAKGKPELRPAKSVIDSVLRIIGLAVLIFVIYRFIDGWSMIDWIQSGREVALPIWLTFGLLPFIYLLSLYAVYESAYVRVKVATDDDKRRRRVLVALLTTFHLRPRELAALRGPWARSVAAAPSVHTAQKTLDQLLARIIHERSVRIASRRQSG